jgi:hypothetical protein
MGTPVTDMPLRHRTSAVDLEDLTFNEHMLELGFLGKANVANGRLRLVVV